MVRCRFPLSQSTTLPTVGGDLGTRSTGNCNGFVYQLSRYCNRLTETKQFARSWMYVLYFDMLFQAYFEIARKFRLSGEELYAFV